MDYIIKGSNVCDCGHKFIPKDIDKLEKIHEHGFYSNIVKNYSLINCPECQKKTALLLKQKGQTWEILNIATEREINIKPVQFKCDICGKLCKNQIGLNLHIKTHQN